MLINKTKTYHLEENAANETLQNILAACDKTPNTIPIQEMSRRPKANILIDNGMMVLTGVLLLTALLFPLCI